ncbi:MAG: hypothetical protein ACFCGT_15095 [Sandaracinaceae bacterium]
MGSYAAEWAPPSPGSTVAFVTIVLAVLMAIVAAAAVATWRAAPQRASRAAGLTAAALALWVAVTGAYVASGAIGLGIPAFMLFFVGSNLAAVVLASSPFGTRLAYHLPLVALVGFQVFRLPLELVLHAWKETGTMPVQMTYEGHNFDIVTGIAAAALIGWALVRRTDIPRGAAFLFNAVGSALLLAVIAIVVLSSPLPVKSYPGAPILLAFHLPYAWIAPVCVAGALFGHLVLWRRLLWPGPDRREARASAPASA